MNAVIDTILKSNKITDYLSNNGINWTSHDGNRYRYKCPMPNHKKDKTPSFFVFDKGDRQDFCCFGCKSYGSIIQFIAAYEQISVRESIQKLSEGLNINIDSIIDSILRDIILDVNKNEKEEKDEDLLANSLFISVHMKDFLNKVEFDPEEVEIAEKVFAFLDGLIKIHSYDEVEDLSTKIPDKTSYRYSKYIENKNKKELDIIRKYKNP